MDRSFTLVGLNSYESGMRSVRIIEGQQPQPVSGPSQVMVDEGAMVFLGWNVGENHIIQVNGAEQEIEVVGVTRGELARTVYFPEPI